MKRNILFGIVAMLAGSLLAADSSPKDDLKAAAKKLGDNYSWKSTVANNAGGGGGGRRGGFGGGPSEGKTASGTTWTSRTMGDNSIETVLQGKNGAVKTPDNGWQSLKELSQDDGSGGFNPGTFIARAMQNFKAPAAEAADLADKTAELKKDGDVYSGDLTEAGAKTLLTFGPPRGGGDGPEISGAKGSVKFWVKDGTLTKYEVKVQGTISFNGNDRDINRTTTIEFKDVGSTKVEVPDDAKKKLS
jgi:hypothetical protein